MENPVFDKNTDTSILSQVREGMRVCDHTSNEIGTVRRVFLGAVSEKENERGGGPAAPSVSELRGETLIDYIAEIFADEPLPDVLRERLLREGFIHIDTSGWFASDRLALPDHIESVSDDCVRLRMTKDELIER